MLVEEQAGKALRHMLVFIHRLKCSSLPWLPMTVGSGSLVSAKLSLTVYLGVDRF